MSIQEWVSEEKLGELNSKDVYRDISFSSSFFFFPTVYQDLSPGQSTLRGSGCPFFSVFVFHLLGLCFV